MKQALRLFACLLQWLALTALPGAVRAQADEHADISALLQSGQAAQALTLAEQRLTEHPRDPQLRFLRALAQTDAGEPERAIASFTELTQEFPELPEPYNNLAVLYARQNQWDQARATLEMALRANPGYATAQENLGDIYAWLASQAYSKAMQLDANSAASVRPKLALTGELLGTGRAPGGDKKMPLTRKIRAALPPMAIMAMTIGAALAADYPGRPIKIVVPYAAGGTIDSMARLLSPKFRAERGQPVLIDNRPGAGTMIGADAVARSEPDGHTLFMGTNSAFTISPHIMDKLPYDPLRSFAAIGTMAPLPNLIVVKPDAPYQTLADVVDAARRGEKISYASFGKGSTAHLSGEAIRVAAAIAIAEIPYKSGPQCVQAVLAGQVSVGLGPSFGSVQRVKRGQLRAVAITSATRSPDLPHVPTVREAGYPSAELVAWVGLFVPAATPAPIRDLLCPPPPHPGRRSGTGFPGRCGARGTSRK